ncbi:hypothetical protein HWV62_7652 [Athelia sp. TMB]|nr:hypothetical protein HWV62_7652 [Athelia sp. TMB]
MQTRRSTRSSVLGKRPHAPDAPSSSAPASPVSSASTSTTTSSCEPFPTPEATPSFKRARTSLTLLEGDWNKENVAPSPCGEVVPSSPRTLRRAASDFERTPTRARTGMGLSSILNPPPSIALVVTAISPSVVLVVPHADPRAAPARHASTSDLLTALATPPPTPAPSALLPLHARARALLRATTTTASPADCLAGRDAERAAIRAFLSDDADENACEGEETNKGVLYISGAPGSGKTALVTALLAETPARAVFVNCMALDGPDALWARLLEELGPAKTGKRGRKPAKEPAGKEGVAQALHALAAASSSTPVLVLDELDAVPPATLAALFALPAGAPVRLVGIANTHTLSASAAAPAEGVRTLHFAPYTPAQLLAILHARLAPLSLSPSPSGHADALKELFAPPTLGLLTKKVAAQTGDVRVLFSVLRGALELAAASSTPTTPTKPTKAGEEEENPLNTPAPRVTVTPAHVLAALKTHAASSPPARTAASSGSGSASSATVESVRALGLHAQLALLALLIAARRLAAGLPLAGPAPSPARTPVSTPKKPRSPTKRTVSSPQCCTLSSSASTSNGGGGIETGALHAFYAGLLARSDACAPVSRSELGDVLGVLEGAGLVALAAPAASTTTTRSPRKLARTASFGGAKSLGTGGAVSVAAGVRAEELLRGLGIVLGPDGGAEAVPGRGVREEEVCAIWERERARLAREVKASEAALRLAGRGEVFGDAMED